MSSHSKSVFVILIGAAGVTLVGTLAIRRQLSQQFSSEEPVAQLATDLPPKYLTNHIEPAGKPPTPLEEMYGRLSIVHDAESCRIVLGEFQALLTKRPLNAAVAEIRSFLDSRTDAPTHLGFKVGSGGLLDEAPTLRTFLLDMLARLDPAAAAEYARVILDRLDSPDEWALALRNLARGDASAEGRALLQQKTGEMLADSQWQQGATTGFLEAFDAAVFLGGTDLLPTLTEIVRQPGNLATTHASFLALDRLVINDPAATLTALRDDLDSMNGREQTRGNFFARADVRDPQQRRILENYLVNPGLSAEELDAFTGTFPNANFMISDNLLTQNRTLDRATLVERDRESLRVVREWLANPNFASRRPALEAMERRLAGFVESADARP